MNRRRSVISLIVVVFLLLGANLLFTAHYVNSTRAALLSQQQTYEAGQRREQVEQRQVGLLVEKAICTDLGTMAAIPAPPGAAASNPSRAYEQAEHRAWTGLDAGLGCKQIGR